MIRLVSQLIVFALTVGILQVSSVNATSVAIERPRGDETRWRYRAPPPSEASSDAGTPVGYEVPQEGEADIVGISSEEDISPAVRTLYDLYREGIQTKSTEIAQKIARAIGSGEGVGGLSDRYATLTEARIMLIALSWAMSQQITEADLGLEETDDVRTPQGRHKAFVKYAYRLLSAMSINGDTTPLFRGFVEDPAACRQFYDKAMLWYAIITEDWSGVEEGKREEIGAVLDMISTAEERAELLSDEDEDDNIDKADESHKIDPTVHFFVLYHALRLPTNERQEFANVAMQLVALKTNTYMQVKLIETLAAVGDAGTRRLFVDEILRMVPHPKDWGTTREQAQREWLSGHLDEILKIIDSITPLEKKAFLTQLSQLVRPDNPNSGLGISVYKGWENFLEII